MSNIKADCIFAKEDYQKDICNGCKALKDMYCKHEGKCNFYKKKSEVK